MILDGDISVIDALKEKKTLMNSGSPHDHIRVLLVCGGGSVKAAYASGACLALAELGYSNCFHTVVGISSGSIPAVYFLSGNALDVKSIFTDVACSKNFIDVRRPFNVLRTKYLRHVLEKHPVAKINIQHILKGGTRFMIALSDFQTAQPFLLEPKDAEEIYEGIRATISMPGAVTDPVYIHGKRYADGEATIPYSRESIYKQPTITHILDITNQDQGQKDFSFIEFFLYKTLYFFMTNKNIQTASYSRTHSRNNFFAHVSRESCIPTCVVWGDGSVGSFENDQVKLRKVVERSQNWWCALLAK